MTNNVIERFRFARKPIDAGRDKRYVLKPTSGRKSYSFIYLTRGEIKGYESTVGVSFCQRD
jgi:hypothetical protein